mgnify:CR=1 FL=1
MKLDITHAILALKPGAEWNLRGDNYSGLEWLDKSQTKPTEEEVVRKLAELEYMDEINQYQRDRKVAYPSAGDQFDRIFHDGVEAWKGDIQGIKNVYPRKYPDPVELKTRQDKAVEDLKSS